MEAPMSTTDTQPRRVFAGMVGDLLPVTERVLLALVGVMLLASIALTGLRGQVVDWLAFLPPFVACGLMVAMGMYLRARKGAERLALGVFGFAVFMSFTGAVAIFIFALFPIAVPLIDPVLVRADATLGYDWVGFVTGLADWPLLGTSLGYVYMTSIPQMVGVILLLAWLDRATELYRFLLVGMGSMVATVTIWHTWPSLGPSAWAAVTPEVEERIGLVFNAELGTELRRLAAEGVPVISPERVMGVIAFPSFHMVMACMVVWFTRGTRVFWPALAVNVAMVPATLSHGGHHLVDILAAVVLFAMCVAVAHRALPLDARAA
jgi:hypothetical protein